MKIYRGYPNRPALLSVTVQTDNGPELALNPRYDLRNHSPDGFAWGYGGSGPSQLALALLADVLANDAEALKLYQDFKWTTVALFPGDGAWELSEASIRNAIRASLTPKQANETPQSGNE